MASLASSLTRIQKNLLRFQARQPSDTKVFDNISIFINDLVNTFTRLEYKHDLKSTMNTQVAIQKLPYSQLVDWSKLCAQHQIESPSLEQFAEWLSLTAQAFENLEPFSRNKLGKNDSTNFSQYGNNHTDMTQITSKEHQDMYPRKTRVPPCG